MPPRKISIADALTALNKHGVDVSVTRQSETIFHPMDTPPVTKVIKASKGYSKVTLFAKHSIANGGQYHPETKTTTGAGYNSYGPGVVTVPSTLAAQLLRQDQEARKADERTRSTERRSFLIVQRQSQGSKAKVGLQVPNEILDSGFDLSNVSQYNQHNVRTM